jgi:hypothetical protein
MNMRSFLKSIAYVALVGVSFILSCSEDEAPLSPTSEFYFLGKVGKQQVLVEEKEGLEFIGGFSDWGANGEGCYASYKSGLYKVYDEGITLTVQISFYNVAHAVQPCDETDLNEVFLSELTPGDYQLSWIENDITTVGIRYYDDKKGIGWSSIDGDQPNTKSFFTVEKSEFLGLDESGKKIQKVEGKFSCYLYDYDFETETVTNSIFVSNAKFVFKFISE